MQLSKRRTKYHQIRNHLIDWMKHSSPMLWAMLQQDRISEDWALKLFVGPRLRLNQEIVKVEAVQMFRTSDGQTFDAEAEATAHENALAAEAQIDSFIASQEYKRGQGTHAKNVLLKFAAWKNGQG